MDVEEIERMKERKERKALSEKLERYRSIRDQIHIFAMSLASRIVTEATTNGCVKNEKLDLALKLLGQQLVELKNCDEKIKDIASAREVDGDVRNSQEFYLKIINRITNPEFGMDNGKLMLLNLECLFPSLQIT